MNEAAVRIDKWLWAVRVFKTRAIAAEACQKGHVSILGHPVKASRDVRVGDVIVLKKEHLTRTFKVLRVIEQRVGAPVAKECAEDLTPASEFQKPRDPYFAPIAPRPKGSGRPTKKDRRIMDLFSE